MDPDRETASLWLARTLAGTSFKWHQRDAPSDRHVKLADLKVRDVQFALGTLAERSSTRSVRLARMILIQAIRNAMVNDLAVRNVAI